MGFIDDNKHFIFHSLTREMRGLSDIERIKKYDFFKEEIRARIKESYSRAGNKAIFYKQIFEVLSFYESDYLMTNLFYDDEVIQVIDFLNKNALFKGLVMVKPDSLSSKYYSFILSRLSFKGNYKREDDIEFLKINIIDNEEGVSESDWKEKDGMEDRHPMISKYSKWLPHNLPDNVKYTKAIRSFMAFVKVWNHFDIFSMPFNNTKAILFYTHIVSKYDGDGFKAIDLYKFVVDLENIYLDLFVNIGYVPLIDKKDSISYKNGYLLKRTELSNLLESAKRVISINKDNSILNLFMSLDPMHELIILERIQTLIDSKLVNYELPNYKEIIEIKDLQLNGEAEAARQYFFEKLYLFEFA